MRSYAGVLVGKLLFATVCCFPVPLVLVVGCVAWDEGENWAWIALIVGLVGSVLIPVIALKDARRQFPRITRRDRVKHENVSYGDDTFVMWAPRSEHGSAQARMVRADVLEASLVRYNPDNEATFTTYSGDLTPNEFTPLIRLKLRVHDAKEAGGADGAAGFEITDTWRVPSLCLSAVTAGRLIGLVDPALSARRPIRRSPERSPPLWPRSALMSGTRTSRMIDLEGRWTDATRRPGWLLQQMRIAREAGGVEMVGDTIDLRGHGPVLDTVLRIRPEDGTPPFDAARRLTVPMDYLSVLHRTREVVLYANPNGRSYVIDWARTNLLAGTTAAKAIAPDGQELAVTGRPDVIWALMNLLASHGLSNPTPVLDLRKRRMSAVAGTLMDVVRGSGTEANAARR
ncbi:hypothetical protein OG413_28590 [Streptomyces sp. NBC_01433]|uniref:hypothetical protein n=1 Tax=Streptomyces sp. NBC_01433 TaxID=2903864 RepID=UPI00225496F7|nr:hypothetical protein [Streptomyces sp. NBC_01433]MCX4679212.1 hypothetical protein [Streptomyces sp. NBC_01433]